MFRFKRRTGGMLRKSGCSWWYPISSGQIIYALITFLIISDLCYLPVPDGFGVGVEARLPRRERNPTTARRREDDNRYHYHSGRHDYRNHPRGNRGGGQRWGRRRNDNQSNSSEIIAATEVFVLDDEQVKSMMMGGSSSSGANSDMMGGEGANSDMAMMTMKDEQETPGGMVGSASSPAANVSMVQEGTAETIGIIRGFLPGLTLGGGGGVKGKGGGGGLFGGRGLFGGGGGGGGGSSGNSNSDTGGGAEGKVIFPEYPGGNAGGENGGGGWSSGGKDANQNSNGGWSSGQQGKGAGSGGGGLFGGGGGGVGGLFRNPFGGGGEGRSPFRILSKLNSDQPCAAGLANLPILNKIPFLPKRRFPSFIPSGVNTCDKTCDAGPGCSEWRRVAPTQKEKEEMGGEDSTCTYNWRDSLTRFPFLLFRCHCKKDKCPKKSVRLSGLLRARCENVSEKKSRCKCPYGQQSYKCVLSFLPVGIPLISRVKPYYCTCCNEGGVGEPLGGYGGGGGYGDSGSTTELAPASSVQIVSGGYEGGGGTGDGKTSASENQPKELAQGKPLGFENIYAHLRRRF